MEDQNTQYLRNPDFIFRKIVEEMILVPIHEDIADMNSIYTLNEVGCYLWEKLAEPITIGELKKAVLEEYDAPPEQVSVDVDQFLNDLGAFSAVQKV